jgi:hypothetical protein
MITNSTLARGTLREGSSAEEDFLSYDCLSPALRFAVMETNGNFSAKAMLDAERRNHTYLVIRNLRITEENDVLRMARAYRTIYKLPYPHVEAQATIMRYGEIIPKPRKVRGYELRLQRKLERLLMKEE